MTLKKYLCGIVAAAVLATTGFYLKNAYAETSDLQFCRKSDFSGRTICVPAERFPISGKLIDKDGCQYYDSFSMRDTWGESIERKVAEVLPALKYEAEKGSLFEEKACTYFDIKFTYRAPYPASLQRSLENVEIWILCDEYSHTMDIADKYSYDGDDLIISRKNDELKTKRIDVDSEERASYFADRLDEIRGIMEMPNTQFINQYLIGRKGFITDIEKKLIAEKKECEEMAEKKKGGK